MAKEAVEVIRKKLYPDLLNAKEEDSGTSGGLKPIQETDTDKDDTVTEDCTSEAFGDTEDDDDDKPRARNEDDEDLGDDLDDDDDDDEDDNDGINADIELTNPTEPEKTLEDLEFEKEFERMATESYLERLKEPVKVTTKDIPVPITMRSSGTKKTYEQLQVS